jgi:hypothetical protein
MRYLVVLSSVLVVAPVDGTERSWWNPFKSQQIPRTDSTIQLPIAEFSKTPPYLTNDVLIQNPPLDQTIPLGKFEHSGSTGQEVNIPYGPKRMKMRIAEYNIAYVPRYFGAWNGVYAAGGALSLLTIGPTFTVVAGVGMILYYAKLSEVIHQNPWAHAGLLSLQNQLGVGKPLSAIVGSRTLEPKYNATCTEVIYDGEVPLNPLVDIKYKIRLIG